MNYNKNKCVLFQTLELHDMHIYITDYSMKKKRRRIKYMDPALPHVLNVDKGTLRHQTFMRDEKSNYQQVRIIFDPYSFTHTILFLYDHTSIFFSLKLHIYY